MTIPARSSRFVSLLPLWYVEVGLVPQVAFHVLSNEGECMGSDVQWLK